MRSKETEKLKLSQFLPDDIPSWLIDYNDDMGKLEKALSGNNISYIGQLGGTKSGTFKLFGLLNAKRTGKVWDIEISAKVSENVPTPTQNFEYGVSVSILQQILGVTLKQNKNSYGILQVYDAQGHYLVGENTPLGFAGYLRSEFQGNTFFSPGRVHSTAGGVGLWDQSLKVSSIGNQWIARLQVEEA